MSNPKGPEHVRSAEEKCENLRDVAFVFTRLIRAFTSLNTLMPISESDEKTIMSCIAPWHLEYSAQAAIAAAQLGNKKILSSKWEMIESMNVQLSSYATIPARRLNQDEFQVIRHLATLMEQVGYCLSEVVFVPKAKINDWLTMGYERAAKQPRNMPKRYWEVSADTRQVATQVWSKSVKLLQQLTSAAGAIKPIEVIASQKQWQPELYKCSKRDISQDMMTQTYGKEMLQHIEVFKGECLSNLPLFQNMYLFDKKYDFDTTKFGVLQQVIKTLYEKYFSGEAKVTETLTSLVTRRTLVYYFGMIRYIGETGVASGQSEDIQQSFRAIKMIFGQLIEIYTNG